MQQYELERAANAFAVRLHQLANTLEHQTNTGGSIQRLDLHLGDVVAELLSMLDVSTSVLGIDSVADGGTLGFPVANVNLALADVTGAVIARVNTTGSTGALGVLIGSALPSYHPERNRIIVDRSAHLSVYGALEDSGYQVDWLHREFCPVCGTERPLDPEQIRKLLGEGPIPAAVVLTSPTYDGVYSDIAAIADVLDRWDVPLLVDSSWGANCRSVAGAKYPAGAITSGATASVVSLHKKSLSISQTSCVLFKCERLGAAYDEAAQKRHTTSPYYPALLVLEARLQSVIDGRWSTAWTQAAIAAEEFVSRLSEVNPFLQHISYSDVGGVAGDPCHILLNTRKLGLSGFDLSNALSDVGCDIEKATNHTVLILFGPGHSNNINRLILKFKEALARCYTHRQPEALELHSGPPPPSSASLSIRSASRSQRVTVPLWHSVGGISAELVTVYPPGTALLVPGEVVTREQVQYLSELRRAGGRIVKASPAGMLKIVEPAP